MGFPLSKQPFTLFSFCISSAFCFAFFVSPSSAADLTNLIFKGCSDQKFQDPSGISAQNLKNLLQSLVSQSSQKSYSTAASGDGPAAINGLYQCRGDLSPAQCYDCVSRIPEKVNKLCGGGASSVAARVQLTGCYLKYEVTGFKQTPETQLLFKVCGSTAATGDGFQQRRDAALDAMANGLKSGGGNGLFATGSYQSVFYLAQCQGDLAGSGGGAGECGNCVKSAVEAVKTQCGGSIGGQAYLNKCYVSYTYYPSGVPIISNTSGGGGGKQHTARTAAIVVGGVAAVGFLVACLLCVKSAVKRSHHGNASKHGHGGGGGWS